MSRSGLGLDEIGLPGLEAVDLPNLLSALALALASMRSPTVADGGLGLSNLGLSMEFVNDDDLLSALVFTTRASIRSLGSLGLSFLGLGVGLVQDADLVSAPGLLSALAFARASRALPPEDAAADCGLGLSELVEMGFSGDTTRVFSNLVNALASRCLPISNFVDCGLAGLVAAAVSGFPILAGVGVLSVRASALASV